MRKAFVDATTSYTAIAHPNGNLYVSGTLGRPGIYNYRDENGGKIYAVRLPEEVGSESYLASVHGSNVVLDHNTSRRDGLVTHAEVSPASGAVSVEMWLFSGVANEIESRTALSAGYTADWVPCQPSDVAGAIAAFPDDAPGSPSDGTWFYQRRLENDHVALVRQGRGGPTCVLDSFEEPLMIVEVDTEKEPEIAQETKSEDVAAIAASLAAVALRVCDAAKNMDLQLAPSDVLSSPDEAYKAIVVKGLGDVANVPEGVSIKDAAEVLLAVAAVKKHSALAKEPMLPKTRAADASQAVPKSKSTAERLREAWGAADARAAKAKQ